MPWRTYDCQLAPSPKSSDDGGGARAGRRGRNVSTTSLLTFRGAVCIIICSSEHLRLSLFPVHPDPHTGVSNIPHLTESKVWAVRIGCSERRNDRNNVIAIY
mmetsp:Transcript_4222/g.7502  ORF Transcript_4222/g.7502 Transcript_4222/m.7502 type:complete len:102 (-) Transcript_4222:361-666(-)